MGFLHVIVLEIDTIGTYNVTKAVYEQYFKVQKEFGIFLSFSCVWPFYNYILQVFSGFSVGFSINEEKVICYQLELGK